MPTLPWERLSTMDHSSATRTGWCSGSTTLPPRRAMRSRVARQGGGEERRIGREAADGVEVAFRQPHSSEIVLVREAGAFEDEAVFVLVIRSRIIAEVVKGEGAAGDFPLRQQRRP